MNLRNFSALATVAMVATVMTMTFSPTPDFDTSSRVLMVDDADIIIKPDYSDDMGYPTTPDFADEMDFPTTPDLV